MKSRLHWLDFPARSIFKLCVIAYRCQRGQAPTYLSELIIPVSTIPGRSHLRSATTGVLLEPACRTVTLGPRAFSSSCPAAWNSLPADLRCTDLSLPLFRKQVKTSFQSVKRFLLRLHDICTVYSLLTMLWDYFKSM